jgi:hypothetical protein
MPDPPQPPVPPAPLDPPPDRSAIVWPYVLGVLSIVQAGQAILGLLATMIQLGINLLTGIGALGSLLPGFGWNSVYLLHQAAQPALAALLMVGGFLLYRRSRLGPRLHLIYAIPAILVAGVFPVAYIAMAPPRYMAQIIFWPIWHATQSVIYPVFLLVWFHRAKIKRQVRGWG